MTLKLAELNRLPPEQAAEQLRACCGSDLWVREMVARRPFTGVGTLLAAGDAAWGATRPADWDEAFAHHPRIGERRAAVAVSAAASAWSAGEQPAGHVTPATRQALADAHSEYEARFGRIYIVCAAGLSMAEILEGLRRRLRNDPETELRIAAEEQRKITALRLRKLVGDLA